MGVVDQAVKDGIGDGWALEHRRLPPLLMGWCLTSR